MSNERDPLSLSDLSEQDRVAKVAAVRRATELVQTTVRNVRETRDAESPAENELEHALGLTIDQRDRAVRALAWEFECNGVIGCEASDLLDEPWAKAVLDD